MAELKIRVLYEFAVTAVTKHPKLVGLKQQKIYSLTVLEVRSPRSR